VSGRSCGSSKQIAVFCNAGVESTNWHQDSLRLLAASPAGPVNDMELRTQNSTTTQAETAVKMLNHSPVRPGSYSAVCWRYASVNGFAKISA
jgi:hypothetical protein